jgi:hypothetical protein
MAASAYDPARVRTVDPRSLGWVHDVAGWTGSATGRAWIKPDGTFYEFAPGVPMLLTEYRTGIERADE